MAIATLARPLNTAASVRNNVARQVLAFYYGWYGNPQTSGMWRHWKLDQNKQPSNITDIPQEGYYDSLDPAAVNEQVALVKKAGITGLIATWWGKHSFEDASLAPLLEAAQHHGLSVSAYLERVEGENVSLRIDAGVEDLLYILRTHAAHPAWLRVDGKPVVFIYSRAGSAISVQDWRTVLERVRDSAPSGLVAIGPTNGPDWLECFDGVHDYNVTGQIYARSDSEIRNWAQAHAKNLVSNAGQRYPV